MWSKARQLPRREAAQTALLRLTRWYSIVLVVFGAVWWASTALPPAAEHATGSPLTGTGALLPLSAMLLRVGEASQGWLAALVQMLAALLLVLPVAGTYVRTRSRAKYDRTLVQTVIVLPVAITAVLMMVSHSLALAFGLAGVVGAVRFRSTLDEAGDTVYLFAAIVIGFAAGIHALGIAVILSVLFVALELSLWYWDLSNPSASYWHHMASGSEETSAPESPSASRPSRDNILRVDVGDLAAAEASTAELLTANVKRHRLVRRLRSEGGIGTLEYAVRLRKHVGRDEVTRLLQDSVKGTIKSVKWSAADNESARRAHYNGKSPEGQKR